MNLFYKNTTTILTVITLIIFYSNIAKAQTKFTISDLQKMCDYSITEMKAYAMAQKYTYSKHSDDNEDAFYYNDGENIAIIEKMKKKDLLKISITSKSNFLSIKESLENYGYKFNSVSEGTPTITFYKNENYKLAFFVKSDTKANKEWYYITVNKLEISKCEEFSITELEALCEYSYRDCENFILQKGYKIIQTDNTYKMVISTCNLSQENSLLINIGKNVRVSINTYALKLMAQLKTKGYQLNLAQSDSSHIYFTNKDYNVLIIKDDKYSFSITKNENNVSTLTIQQLTDSIKRKPSNSEFYYYRGLLHKADNNLNLALQDLTKAINFNPKDIKAYLNRASIYYSQDKDSLAIADYSFAIGIKADLVSTYYNRGNCYLNMNQYDLAISDFTTYIKSNQTNYKAYQNRGKSYQNLKNDSLAIEDFNKAIELYQKDESVYIDRGISLFKRWDYKSFNYRWKNESIKYNWKFESGTEDFFKALSINPKNTKAYLGMVDIVFSCEKDFQHEYGWSIYLDFREGKTNKMIESRKIASTIEVRIFETINKLIAINPDVPIGYAIRASIYNILERTEEAIEDCKKAISLNPDYTYAYTVRAMSYFIVKNYQLAINDYTMAIKLKNDVAYYYNRRGNIYKKIGSREHALKDFLQAVKLDPVNKDFKKDLEEIDKK